MPYPLNKNFLKNFISHFFPTVPTTVRLYFVFQKQFLCIAKIIIDICSILCLLDDDGRSDTDVRSVTLQYAKMEIEENSEQ